MVLERWLQRCWRDGYRHWPLIDLHYLVYEVFRDRFPLNIDNLLSSKTDAYFVATDATTYQPHYFRPDKETVYQVMRACMSLPGAAPERSLIDGHGFIDGAVADPVPISKALELGADRFLVILTVPPDMAPRRPGFVERIVARRYFHDNPGLSDVCCNRDDPLDASLKQLEKLEVEQPDTMVIIRPERRLPAGRITRSRRKIVDTVKIGYDQVIRNQRRIRTLLE